MRQEIKQERFKMVKEIANGFGKNADLNFK
jgi:hypothetical protein